MRIIINKKSVLSPILIISILYIIFLLIARSTTGAEPNRPFTKLPVINGSNDTKFIKPVEHKELLDIMEQELKVSDSTANQELVNKFSQYPKQQKLETAAYCLKENK